MTVRILRGDCRYELQRLPAGSVHTALTSPPYYGLRDYGIPPSIWGGDPACEHVFDLDVPGRRQTGGKDSSTLGATGSAFCRCGAWRGCLGLEPAPELFIAHMVEVFEEVRRVLRDDGTLWLNIGDSYYSPRYPGGVGENSTINGQDGQEQLRVARRAQRVGQTGNKGSDKHNEFAPNRALKLAGLKPKDMIGIPWMLAFALRAAGWYLRQEIIWHKPNPMPESVTDRCTKAHEHVFLLSKSERYFYDATAIEERASENTHARGTGIGKKNAGTPFGEGIRHNADFASATNDLTATRNKRSVWTIGTQPFAEAHFATFPPDLVEPMIRASTSERGCCASCAAPWERVTARRRVNASNASKAGTTIAGKGAPPGHEKPGDDVRAGPVVEKVTLGWYPACGCDDPVPLPLYPPRPKSDADKPAWQEACEKVDRARWLLCLSVAYMRTERAVVLDPFGGAGTTGLVADRLQRDAVLIELNPEYADMAERRITAEALPIFGANVAAE